MILSLLISFNVNSINSSILHANLTSQRNHILPRFFIYFNIDTLPFSPPLSFFFLSSFPFFNIHISIMYPLFAICPSTLFAMFKKIDLYVTSSLSHFRSSRIVPLRLMCTLSELDSREFIDPSTHDRQRNGRMGGGKRGSRSTISRDNRYRSSSTWFELAFDSFSARDTRYIILGYELQYHIHFRAMDRMK